MKNRFLSAALLLGALAVLGGCKKDSDTQPTTGTVSVEVENVAKMSAANGGTKSVTADKTTVFTTATNDNFTVSTFEYYISNLVLTKADGSSYTVPNFYHLVDASKPTTTEFTLTGVPTGDYTGMRFVVGVDSAMTKADPLTYVGALNDLNSANNMYWDWNTGHIFLKLEGQAPATSAHTFRAHVGGFRKPYSAIVTASPAFNGNTLLVRADHSPEIHLTADVLKVFDGPNSFSPSTFPTSMMPSATTAKMAQNYAVGTSGGGMFALEHIHAN